MANEMQSVPNQKSTFFRSAWVLGLIALLGGLGLGLGLSIGQRFISDGTVEKDIVQGDVGNNNEAVSDTVGTDDVDDINTDDAAYTAVIMEIDGKSITVAYPDERDEDGLPIEASYILSDEIDLNANVLKTQEEIDKELGISRIVINDEEPLGLPPTSISDPYKNLDLEIADFKKDDLVEMHGFGDIHDGYFQLQEIIWIAAVIEFSGPDSVPLVSSENRFE